MAGATVDREGRDGVLRRAVARVTATSPQQRDVALAVVVGIVAGLLHVGLTGAADQLMEGPLGLVVLAAMAGVLAFRRSHPHQILAASGALISLYYLLGADSPAGVLVFVFALYAATAFGESRREGLVGLGASTFFMTLSYVLSGGVGEVVTANYLLVLFTFAIAWALGDATHVRLALAQELRARADQLDALRRAEQADLVAAERRRIARELHDVVSHTVAVVVVQAGAAGRVLDADPEAARAALSAIEERGRDAMVELRRMLGVLRAGDGHVEHDVGPAPDMAAVGTLVDSLAAAGLPAELHADLGEELPAGVALTVHRIVQEGLTNVLRHAEDVRRVEVTIERHDGELVVQVRDDGRPAGFTGGAGTGLLGLRERVALHGGSVEAGPRRTGRGYLLRAQVPLGSGA